MQLSQAIVIWVTSLLATTAAQSLESTLSKHPSLSILHELLVQFDLLDSFNDFSNVTFIAPTDDAYRALAQWGFNVSEVEPYIARALLTYHVLDGEYMSSSVPAFAEKQVVHSFLQPPTLTNVSKGAAVKLSQADGTIVTESGLQVLGGVEEADIIFDNGIIHTLNSSMVLPHNISTTAALAGLNGFLNAMDAADDVSTLESLKDATFFIPYDDALKKLSPLLKLLSPEQLAQVLRYHAIPNEVLYSESLVGGDSTFETLQGGIIRVHNDEAGEIYVNNARILRQDMIIYGGVAHVIDDVLIPSSLSSSTSSRPLDSPNAPARSVQMQKTPWTLLVLW